MDQPDRSRPARNAGRLLCNITGKFLLKQARSRAPSEGNFKRHFQLISLSCILRFHIAVFYFTRKYIYKEPNCPDGKDPELPSFIFRDER